MSADTLYFVQHGLALDKADDPERPLSEKGIEQTQAIARQLHHATIPISQIFHSGKLRASQTAELIASIMNVKSIAAIDHLSPNDNVELLAKNLTINNALYIGHLPHLEKLVSYLVTENEHLNIIKFQNSAVLCLQKSSHLYYVQWYLTPELLIN